MKKITIESWSDFIYLILFIFSLCLFVMSIYLQLTKPEQPQPEPLPLPTQSLRARNYETFIPLAYLPGSKKGVGLTYGHCEDAADMGASWFYQWSPWPNECEGVESVPMIWGVNDIGKTPRGTSGWLLGFNEPDRENQANLTPARAAELWREVERLYGDDWKLVSPAVSHTALEWLPQFVGAYLELYGHMPQLDALALHCYANDVDECIEAVRTVIGYTAQLGITGGVWVTEFAFWPVGAEEVASGLGKARRFIGWMGGEHHLRRYAWFAARIKGDEWWVGPSTALVKFDGSSLTVYGEMYKGE